MTKFRNSTLLFSLFLFSACSGGDEQNMQNILRDEFIATYEYTSEQFEVSENLSNYFENMTRDNNEALSSIAYRWHSLALAECQTSKPNRSASTPRKQSSYEKMLSAESRNEQRIEISSDVDRKCLAQVYVSSWQHINNSLKLNYPNIR